MRLQLRSDASGFWVSQDLQQLLKTGRRNKRCPSQHVLQRLRPLLEHVSRPQRQVSVSPGAAYLAIAHTAQE